MTPENFVYWLQGHCELNPDTPPTEDQWKLIQEHLQLVFTKVTNPLKGSEDNKSRKDWKDWPVMPSPFSIPEPFIQKLYNPLTQTEITC